MRQPSGITREGDAEQASRVRRSSSGTSHPRADRCIEATNPCFTRLVCFSFRSTALIIRNRICHASSSPKYSASGHAMARTGVFFQRHATDLGLSRHRICSGLPHLTTNEIFNAPHTNHRPDALGWGALPHSCRRACCHAATNRCMRHASRQCSLLIDSRRT